MCSGITPGMMEPEVRTARRSLRVSAHHDGTHRFIGPSCVFHITPGQKNLSAMFAPPYDLMFRGNFEEV